MKKMKRASKHKKIKTNIPKIHKPFELDPDIVHIFTDGSCWYGDRSGGWAAVLLFNEHKKEIFGGKPGTTSNQMELTGILEGIKALKNNKHCAIVYSDSQYCVNAVSVWHKGWARNNWRTSQGAEVKNKELIQEIVQHAENHSRIIFKWVKGHIGITHNERADELAGKGRKLYGRN